MRCQGIHRHVSNKSNNFILVSSGNCAPGSRSYSDLADTWTDSVHIPQLVLKPCSKAACIMQVAAYGSFKLMHSSLQDTLRIRYTTLFASQINSQISNFQQMDRLMDTYTGYVKRCCFSTSQEILWKSSNRLQAISSLQDSYKDQSRLCLKLSHRKQFRHTLVHTRYSVWLHHC